MSVFSEDCLAGGTYLVTGASSGIGRATALMIAKCGGNVIAAGRDELRLQSLLAEMEPRGRHITSAQTLTDADRTAGWVKELVASHGQLAGVFHAAGVEMFLPIRMTKQAQLQEVFGSSLFAAFGIARAVSQKDTFASGGSLVFMSSVAGSTGQSGITAYSASKAGIDGLVRSLACELAPRNVRVNSVAAGAIVTAMHERSVRLSGEAATAAFEKNHLLGFGQANDVANAAIFLLSGASRWITGSTIAVDGGYMVR